jgi:hypothetical protein
MGAGGICRTMRNLNTRGYTWRLLTEPLRKLEAWAAEIPCTCLIVQKRILGDEDFGGGGVVEVHNRPRSRNLVNAVLYNTTCLFPLTPTLYEGSFWVPHCPVWRWSYFFLIWNYSGNICWFYVMWKLACVRVLCYVGRWYWIVRVGGF